MDKFLRLLIIAFSLNARPTLPHTNHAAFPPAQPSNTQAQTSTQSLRKLATTIALKHKLPPALVHRLIQVESGWRISAFKYEPHLKESSIGLMQLLPSTARLPAAALLIPEVNIAAGCRYLKWCMNAAKGNTHRALMCYNGGPRCLTQHCPTAESYAAQI